MKYRLILLLILGVDALVLFTQTSELSISYHEASLLYDEPSLLQTIMKTSLYIFGQNDFALRLPMIIFHLLSVCLLYVISKIYIDSDKNRIWLIIVFILLPGVISSALLIDSAGLVILGLLFFIYSYERFSKNFIYLLLICYMFLGGGFLYLYLALALYSLYNKDRKFFFFNFFAFIICLYIYGIDTQGLPQGHFLDSLGIYAAIFTPIVFVYLFYVLYRRYLTKDMNILWFISSTALLFSLILSFRQRVEVEHFAPYLIVALPLAAQTFTHSYKVRLKMFRTKYKMIFVASLIFLLLNSFLVVFHKEIYLLIDQPRRHFAYKMHIAKELAQELKNKNITCLDTNNNMLKRLNFYGISKCNNYWLTQKSFDKNTSYDIVIKYKGRPIYCANIIEEDSF